MIQKHKLFKTFTKLIKQMIYIDGSIMKERPYFFTEIYMGNDKGLQCCLKTNRKNKAKNANEQ